MQDRNGELLATALTARNSGVRASSLLKLSQRFSEVVALDFDLTCTARLQVYDMERERRQVEAMGIGALTSAFGGGSGGMVDRSNAVALDA